MALAVYPPELSPFFLLAGFQSTPPDRRIITQPNRGRVWMRGGPNASGGGLVSASDIFTNNERMRFWRFWREEIDEGTKPFRLFDQQLYGRPIANEDGLLILTESGAPILIVAYWVCQFSDDVPDETPVSLIYWKLNFHLRVLVP